MFNLFFPASQDKNLCEDATADAPFGGASPQTVEGVEEKKEELPAVTDCTTLTLVEAVPSQSASLLADKKDLGNDAFPEGVAAGIAPHEDNFSAAMTANFENLSQPQNQTQLSQSALLVVENQNCSDELRISHEDTFSAAVTANSENPSHPQNQAQPSQSASLPAKNEDLGGEAIALNEDRLSAAPAISNLPAQEPKAHHEGVCAVAADSDPEKWSYEAVVERSGSNAIL